ncbi:MAG: CHAD domain-containing protein [Halanaerobium sp.]
MKTAAVDILKSVSKTKRKAFKKEFKNLKKGDRSEETIHDARVAARRLNALLEVLSIIKKSNKNNKKISKTIKKSRKKLGGTRDLQIARDFLSKNQQDIANFDFDLFEDYYLQTQKKFFKEINSFINDFKLKKINKKLKKIIKKSLKDFNDQLPLDSIFGEIENEKKTLLLDFELLNKDDKSSFHQLRKDLKKLRYKLEIMNEIDSGDYNIDLYKTFQDELGEIQDIVVIKEILNNKFQSVDTKADLESLNDFLDKKQNNIIDNVLNEKDLFLKMMARLTTE